MKAKPFLISVLLMIGILIHVVSALSITVSTDKSAYSKGETVKVTGSIQGASSYPVSFIWEAKDSKGSRIDLGQATTDNNGKFSFSFIIKSSSSLGKATIIISYSGITASKNLYIKEQSSLSISASPTSIIVGSKVTISGKLTPNIQGVKIRILVYSSGSWKELATTSTNSEGRYSYTWTISREGTYRIKATWNGNDKYFESSSKEISIKVTKPKPILSIRVSASKVNLNGTIKVTGSLTLVKNAKVILSIKDPTGKVIKREISVTNGKFSYVFKPDKIGRWTIKAIWSGNSEYRSTESRTLSVIVTKASSNLKIFVYPEKIKAFEKIHINGTLYPPIKDAELTIIVRNTSKIIFQRQILTDQNGTFSFSVIMNSSGHWDIGVSWNGNQKYDKCSITASVFVAKRLSSISLVKINNPIYTIGEKILVNGSLSPGIENTMLKIKISADGGRTWIYNSTLKTGKDGKFTFVWEPKKPGTYLVYLMWDGNNAFSNTSITYRLKVFKEIKESRIKLEDGEAKILLFSNTSILEYNVDERVLAINIKLKLESVSYLKVYVDKKIYSTCNASPYSSQMLVKNGNINYSSVSEQKGYFILEYLVSGLNDTVEATIVLLPKNLTLKIVDVENRPVSNVQISLCWLNNPILNYTATTGPNGEAKFLNIPCGDYLVTAFYGGKRVGEKKVSIMKNYFLKLSTSIGYYKREYKKIVQKYSELKAKYNRLEQEYLGIMREKRLLLTLLIILLLVIIAIIAYLLVEHYMKE